MIVHVDSGSQILPHVYIHVSSIQLSSHVQVLIDVSVSWDLGMASVLYVHVDSGSHISHMYMYPRLPSHVKVFLNVSLSWHGISSPPRRHNIVLPNTAFDAVMAILDNWLSYMYSYRNPMSAFSMCRLN